MQVRPGFSYERLRPVAIIIAAILFIDLIVSLVSIHMGLGQAPATLPSPWLLIGEGMFLIVIACLAVSFRTSNEILKIQGDLEERTRNLENEKDLRLRAEGELELILKGLERRIEEQTLLSTVIEQTEDNVLITDNKRTIIYINPAFERSCGYISEELKGKSLKYLRSDQHDNTFFQTMKETLDRGEVWMGNIINKGKSGVDFEIEGTISPIRDSSGNITYWVAVGRNMSRFRKLEKELQRAQKMDALGTLAGGIAHDFNNILAAVMGLIEMELMGAATGSRTSQRMEQALAACDRARNLVKQILTFSSQGEQRRKPLRIGPLVEDALQMLRATLPATITIKTDLQAPQTLILGDATQIHQVLVNLCTNAAHSMRRSGGILEVGLQEVQADTSPCFDQSGLQPGAYLCLTVKDTGEGMDRRIRERIFEPFFTTKGPGEGAGVGLSVVHGIVKSHGGKIIVQSELGKGSCFKLYFPKIEGLEDHPEKQVESPPSGNERILLVDDEELVVSVATEMLRALGYEVVSVPKSSEALELFRLQPNRFHLLITDQTMPGMTGMELAAEVLKIRNDMPIILCTGFSKENVRETATTTGIRKVLSKPFVLQELAVSVRQALGHHR